MPKMPLKSITTNKTSTPSCSGPIPAKKIRSDFVPWTVFSNTMPNMDFYYSQRFSLEKHTKLIYHQSSLISPIKINKKLRKITPPI